LFFKTLIGSYVWKLQLFIVEMLVHCSSYRFPSSLRGLLVTPLSLFSINLVLKEFHLETSLKFSVGSVSGIV